MGVQASVEHGALVITIEGPYTVEEFHGIVEAVLSDPSWQGRVPVVLDARAARRSDLSTGDLQHIAHLFAEYSDVVLPRRAHVLPATGSERAKSKIGAVIAKVWHGHEIQTFDDFDEGVEWATEGDGDQPAP